MADEDKKITQLDELFIANTLRDVFPIVDVSESSPLVGETMKMTVDRLMGSPGPIGHYSPDEGTFTVLELSIGPEVNEISIDTSLGDNSDDILPTQKAVKTYVDNSIADVASAILNPVHVSIDSTANVGDVMLVDTTNGDITITMIGNTKGRIIIKKVSTDFNEVIIVPNTGTIDGNPNTRLTTEYESLSIVTDTHNFYVV